MNTQDRRLTVHIRKDGATLYLGVRPEAFAASGLNMDDVVTLRLRGQVIRGVIRAASGNQIWIATIRGWSRQRVSDLIHSAGVEYRTLEDVVVEDVDTTGEPPRREPPRVPPGKAETSAPEVSEPPEIQLARDQCAHGFTPTPTDGSTGLQPADLRRGLCSYWQEIETRSADVRQREARFASLAERYASRQPPHFERVDLELIMHWKHTDARWRQRALEGLSRVDDERIRNTTARIEESSDPRVALRLFEGFAHGVGVASVSALLAAARPDLFPVIDQFALVALVRYEPAAWHERVKYDEKGRPVAEASIYPDFVDTCRRLAKSTLEASGDADWTPRRIEMALWGLGKRLAARTGDAPRT